MGFRAAWEGHGMAEPTAIGAAARAPRPPRARRAPLAPIARETLQERVYRELRRALINGRFNPGQALTVSELAGSLRTSAMPVREAVARLVSEQALEAASNRSVRVPPVDAGRLADLLQARRVIEGTALELAAGRLTTEDFSALCAANEDYARIASRPSRHSLDAAFDANLAFHFRLYGACGSPVLTRIIESLWLQSGALVRSAIEAFRSDSAVSAFHFHSQILDSLERGDVGAAKVALAEDIGRAFALLRDKLEEKGAR
jgi:DNA-binding GntR family transcriptional regulator